MSDISLEWFFQIPGLFITIGVLLILIALLVLIIGSSKAKNKKGDDLALVDDIEQEPVVNPNNPVNLSNNNVSVNHLTGINNLGSNNSLNNINGVRAINNVDNLTNDVNNLVDNNVNPVITPLQVISEIAPSPIVNGVVTPVVESSQNTITPISINDSIEKTMIENTNEITPVVNKTLTEPTPIAIQPVATSVTEPIAVEKQEVTEPPIIGPISPSVEINPAMVSTIDNQPDANNQVVSNTVQTEATMASIFSEPVINSVDNLNSGNINNNVVSDIVVPIAPTEVVETVGVTETAIDLPDNLGVLNNINSNSIANNSVPPIIDSNTLSSMMDSMKIVEPIEPIKQKVSIDNNVDLVSTTIPNVNDNINTNPAVTNNEVEEIL